MASFLIISLLSVHLWVMNLASAGPLLGFWLARGWRDDPERNEIGRSLSKLCVWAYLLGVATGAVHLFGSPNPGVLAALDRLPSRALWFAGAELLFSFVCLLCIASFWNQLREYRWLHALIALASSSNLLYHFPPLMSVFGKLAVDPNWAKADVLNRDELLPLMMRGEILALSAHFALASVAVAAITLLWQLSRVGTGGWEKSKLPLSRKAAWVALIATGFQLPVGGWLLTAVPQSVRASMMGSSLTASLAFVGALLLMFILLQRLLAIAIGTATPAELRQAFWTLAALVVLMTATLYESRADDIRPAGIEVNTKTAVVPSIELLRGTTAAGSQASDSTAKD